MEKSNLLLLVLFLHFLADFILQPRNMGRKKSEHKGYLVLHILIQFLVMLIGTSYFLDRTTALWLATSNAAIHGVVDTFIWRLYKNTVKWRRPKHLMVDGTFRYWEDHWFYCFIGFDQLLHTVTLVMLVKYL
jgi:hypothetical protein